MSKKTSPARIDDELFASAKLIGPLLSRSASQQVAHWARIGRELELSPAVSYRAVSEAIRGRRDYDTLSLEEQAIVRAEWTARMAERIAALNMADELTGGGQAFAELDDDGNVVTHDPSGA